MRAISWILGGVTVVLCVIGLFAYSGARETEQAEQKAQELTQRLEQEGLRAPHPDILVRSLGDDGGNVCDNPANALGKATLFSLLTNGASHVGQRPVIVDRRVLQGQALIMDTYCPDKLADYREAIDELKTDSVLKR